MKKQDIEAYLTGELSPEAQQAFEAEMAENQAFAQEVARHRQLIGDIEDAVLWERVTAAQAHQNQRPGWHWLALFALVLGAGGLWWYTQNFSSEKKENHAPPAEQVAPVPDAPPTETPSAELVPPARAEGNTTPTNRPIAESKPDRTLPAPLHPAPQLRGQGQADTSRKALLDAIWYTEYPPDGVQFSEAYQPVDELLRQRDFSKSYARLQLLERKMPANDTLFFLKGYCLLERGEGGEALRYFGKIKDETPFGKELLEWYRGLAFLLQKEDRQAKKIFTNISGNQAHPFHKQAQQTLKMLD